MQATSWWDADERGFTQIYGIRVNPHPKTNYSM
jgi:hypothetical protein